MGVRTIRVHAVDHVLQQHERLPALVRLELRLLAARLQADDAQQAQREDDERDQHLDHRESAVADSGTRRKSCKLVRQSSKGSHQLHVFVPPPNA